MMEREKERERERRASTSTIGTLPRHTTPPRQAVVVSSTRRPQLLQSQSPSAFSSSPRGASGSGEGRAGQSQKRKTSFSLRMKALKEVGVDVLRGVSSIGMGVGSGVRM